MIVFLSIVRLLVIILGNLALTMKSKLFIFDNEFRVFLCRLGKGLDGRGGRDRGLPQDVTIRRQLQTLNMGWVGLLKDYVLLLSCFCEYTD